MMIKENKEEDIRKEERWMKVKTWNVIRMKKELRINKVKKMMLYKMMQKCLVRYFKDVNTCAYTIQSSMV